VLTFAHAGGDLLREVLSGCRQLACTSGTGVIPICHAALSTWRTVEARDGAPSALAVRSVRALVGTMITVIQATSGASRWCETAFAAPEAVSSFLQVFPAAQFVCLYRGLPGVLGEGLWAYPYGLGGSPFWSYASPHPGNSVATITAYWTACTERLLDFESAHAQRCLRVRHEDLAADTERVAGKVLEFLGVDPGELVALSATQSAPGVSLVADPADYLEHVPGPLRARADRLTGRLGYPELSAVGGPAQLLDRYDLSHHRS